ncbi:MAG: hypothetical protein ACTS2F_05105 [Thainema sp.]
MEYWEFLLQKKGDRSWLPLESSDVEILEGRYRIVARSSRKDTPVEIQIRHTSPEDVPPRWHTKKRSGHTNNSGLVSIVPFVHFRPGMWELRCTNDLMSDFVGERWLYAVKLQVVAHEEMTDEDWSGPVVDASRPDPDISVDEIALNAAVTSDLDPDASFSTNAQPDLDLADLPLSDRDAQEVDVPAYAETASVDEPEEIAADNVVLEPPLEAEADDVDLEVELSELAQMQPNLDASASDPAEYSAADSATVTPANNWDGAMPSSETTMPHDPLPTHADWRSLAEQMSQNVVDEAFLDVESAIDPQRDVAQHSGANRDRTLPSDAAGKLTLADRPVQLQLQTDAYIVKGGRPVQLAGAIALADPNTDSSADQADSPQLPESVLTIRLFDPQTAQTIDRIQQTVPAQPLPATFQVAIAPPAHRSHLILGELTLSAEVGGQLLVSASQEFSITTDLNELLDAIANQDMFAAEEAADPIELFNFDAPPVDVAAPFLNTDEERPSATADADETASGETATSETAAKPKIEFQPPQAIPFQPSLFQPKLGMSLPPQIRSSAASANRAPSTDQSSALTPAQPAPQPTEPAPANSSNRFEPLLPKLPTLRPIQAQGTAQANGDEPENQVATNPEETSSDVVSSVDAANGDDSVTANLYGEDAISVDNGADDLADNESLAEADLDDQANEFAPSAVPGSNRPQPTDESRDESLTDIGFDPFEVPADPQVNHSSEIDSVRADDLSDDAEIEEDVTVREVDLDFADQADAMDEAGEEPTFELDITAEPAPANPLEQSFLSLNLQDRFFSRLSALAFDAQAAQMQQIEDSTAYRPHGVDFDALSEFQSFDREGQPNDNDSASLPAESLLPDFDSSPSAEELAREAELTANEVVIYDDEIVVDDVEADVVPPSGSPAIANSTHPNPINDAIEPDIDSWSNLPPLPVPQLKLPAGDLKAGEALDVQVRLPSHPLRVYIKFWMSDRQMRIILDGPRWLADLEPDGQGYLETVVPLIVPKGCLEVQIEAVTVEVATQRQSQKASFNRDVLPMDLPTVSFDEFDLT